MSCICTLALGAYVDSKHLAETSVQLQIDMHELYAAQQTQLHSYQGYKDMLAWSCVGEAKIQ